MSNDESRELLKTGFMYLLGILQVVVIGWCFYISKLSGDNTNRLYTIEEKSKNQEILLREIQIDTKVILSKVK